MSDLAKVTELNIYQRLNEVRKELGYIKKDKDVNGRYKAVTHDTVTAEVRPLLIKHGIVKIISLLSDSVEATGTTTKSGVPIIRYQGLFSVEFIDMDNPRDKVRMRVPAHALDEGDKAPGKAMSYAVKYAELKILDLETGEDDEARVSQHDKKQPLSPHQAKTLTHLLNLAGEKAQAYFSETYGAIDDLSRGDYNELETRLKNAARANRSEQNASA